jgi:hypothetical protein
MELCVDFSVGDLNRPEVDMIPDKPGQGPKKRGKRPFPSAPNKLPNGTIARNHNVKQIANPNS